MTAERIGTINELEVNKAHRVVLDGTAIAVVKDSAGTVHAIGDTCTHGDISLSEGFVEDEGIECWAHGSLFSLTTGKPLTLPAFEPVPVFVVTVDAQGVIYIDPHEKVAVS
jgi:3-phenylpropionate/trans-cinnamate dioxygenase ferredoxin subunit